MLWNTRDARASHRAKSVMRFCARASFSRCSLFWRLFPFARCRILSGHAVPKKLCLRECFFPDLLRSLDAYFLLAHPPMCVVSSVESRLPRHRRFRSDLIFETSLLQRCFVSRVGLLQIRVVTRDFPISEALSSEPLRFRKTPCLRGCLSPTERRIFIQCALPCFYLPIFTAPTSKPRRRSSNRIA